MHDTSNIREILIKRPLTAMFFVESEKVKLARRFPPLDTTKWVLVKSISEGFGESYPNHLASLYGFYS